SAACRGAPSPPMPVITGRPAGRSGSTPHQPEAAHRRSRSVGDAVLRGPRFLTIYCDIAERYDMTAITHKSINAFPAGKQAPALQGFFSIMEHWGADNRTARRLLGSPAERTFYDWKKGKIGRLPDDTLRRIGYVA